MSRRNKEQSWFKTAWAPRGPSTGWPTSWKGWVAIGVAIFAMLGAWFVWPSDPAYMPASMFSVIVVFMAAAIFFATKTGGDDRPSRRASLEEEELDRAERERQRHPFDLKG